MKNKIVAFLTAIILAAALLPTAVFAKGGVIRAEQVVGKPNETISVPIRLESNPGLVALQLKVSYDASALTLTEIEDGGILNGENHGKNLTKNPYTLDWNDDTAEHNNTENGVIVTLRFTVADNAAEGSYPIAVSVKECWNYDMEAVNLDTVNGSVTISSSQPAQIISVSKTSGGASAFVSCSIQNATVYCAAYDKDGRMTGIDSKPVVSGQNTYTFSVGTAHSVKVFVLSDGVKPLCPTVQKSFN